MYTLYKQRIQTSARSWSRQPNFIPVAFFIMQTFICFCHLPHMQKSTSLIWNIVSFFIIRFNSLFPPHPFIQGVERSSPTKETHVTVWFFNPLFNQSSGLFNSLRSNLYLKIIPGLYSLSDVSEGLGCYKSCKNSCCRSNLIQVCWHVMCLCAHFHITQYLSTHATTIQACSYTTS